MNRKHLILGILVGHLLIIYFILAEISSRLFNRRIHPPAITTPLIYGTAVSILTYIILGLKNGLISVSLITATLGIEYLLEKNSEMEVKL